MFVPSRLAADYEELRKDDVLKNLRENLAVMGALVREKVRGMEGESSAEHWKLAGSSFEDLKRAVARGEQEDILEALRRHETVLREGAGAQAKEREACELMMQAGDLSRVEIMRQDKLARFMTAEQALANQAAILAILRKHVDPVVLASVSSEFGKMAHAMYF